MAVPGAIGGGGESDLLSDRLLLAFAQTHDLDRLSAQLAIDPGFSHRDALARYRNEARGALEATGARFPDALQDLSRGFDAPWLELLGCLRVAQLRDEGRAVEYGQLQQAFARVLGEESYVVGLAIAAHASVLSRSGHLDLAEVQLRSLDTVVARVPTGFRREFLSCIARYTHGRVRKCRGDFLGAHRNLTRALEYARELGLVVAVGIRSQLAALHWASGQPDRGYRLHTDREHREQLLSLGKHHYLIRSQIYASKCALDAGDLGAAERELAGAAEGMREYPGFPSMLRGYYLLYCGELEIARGRPDEGGDLLDRACEHFETMDPPLHAGLLEAKIAIGHFAIGRGDEEKAIEVIRRLIEEAEEKGCLEARARLLVLETSLFVSEHPPLRAAYEDVITRLHLINNPALLFQALANLYTHSVRYREEEDQAFLMGRLRNVRKLLEESCYRDLYERYVLDRYSWAIENRLAERLEELEGLLPPTDEEE